MTQRERSSVAKAAKVANRDIKPPAAGARRNVAKAANLANPDELPAISEIGGDAKAANLANPDEALPVGDAGNVAKAANLANPPFTVDGLRSVVIPAGAAEVSINDPKTPGMAARIQRAGGSIVFSLRYRLPGQPSPKRLTIGKLGVVSIKEAREIAARALLLAKGGTDPAQAAKARAAETVAAATAAGPTLAVLIDSYEREQIANGVKGAITDAATLRREYSSLLGHPAGAIDRPALLKILRRVRDGVPGHAAPRPGLAVRLQALTQGVLNHGANDGVIAANPLAGFKKKRGSRRAIAEKDEAQDIMLTMADVAVLWCAAGDKRNAPGFGPLVRFLIVTGCRRSEAAAARWTWLAADRLNIPGEFTKNGRAHSVPTPAYLAEIIAAQPRHARVPQIFAGGISRQTGKRAQISGWSKSWGKLLKLAKDEYGFSGADITLHDLRKNLRSHYSRLGVDARVGSKQLNHTAKDRLEAVYDRYQWWPERVAAADLWMAEILMALGETGGENIVRLRARA